MLFLLSLLTFLHQGRHEGRQALLLSLPLTLAQHRLDTILRQNSVYITTRALRCQVCDNLIPKNYVYC